MDVDTFNKLKRLAEREIAFDATNVYEVSARVPNLYQKYLDIYMNEYKILKKIDIDMDKLYGEKLKHYKHSDNYKWDNKGELDSQIKSDNDYHTKRIEHAKQEHIVKYLEEVLDNIKRLSFSIKNYIDLQKFKHGVF